MILLWGFRSKVTQLAVLTYLCARCSNPAAHPLHKIVRKFTLFFIPLFPVSTKYVSQCTFCGLTTKVSKEDAERVLASLSEPTPQVAAAAEHLEHATDPAPTFEHPAP